MNAQRVTFKYRLKYATIIKTFDTLAIGLAYKQLLINGGNEVISHSYQWNRYD